jgi:hypothetical protein
LMRSDAVNSSSLSATKLRWQKLKSSSKHTHSAASRYAKGIAAEGQRLSRS